MGVLCLLLVIDLFMVECGYCERLQLALDAAGLAYGLFGDCVPDPTTDCVYAVLATLREGNYDCIVALGGGSSMDTAKAVAVLAEHGGIMRDYKVPATVDSGLPVIAVSTTVGIGLEVIWVVVIIDIEI